MSVQNVLDQHVVTVPLARSFRFKRKRLLLTWTRLIREKCPEQKCSVHELAIMTDSVPLSVRVNPDDSASETTRQIKG